MQSISSLTEIPIKIKKTKKKPFDNRIALIDFLRGILICLVIFDHFMYDLKDFLPSFMEMFGTTGPVYDWFYTHVMDYGNEHSYFQNEFRHVIRMTALNSFLLLSGISCAFSKNNWKRACKMLGFSIGLLILSNIAHGYACEIGFIDPNTHTSLIINFNVIAVIGVCVLIYAFFDKKGPEFFFFFVVVLALVHFFLVPKITADLSDQPILALPIFKPDSILINGKPYYQADFMPLFPYAVSFFIGVAISKIIYEKPSDHLSHNYKWMKPMCFCGRHSLAFYVLHQIVIIPLFFMFKYIFKAFL